MNNIKTMTPAATAARGLIVKQINLLHNSFLLSWPFNPDPTSSNVSAIELYHKDGCQRLTIEGNIFAFNPGGAMQHDWPEDRMPDLAIRNNLFYMNSALSRTAMRKTASSPASSAPIPSTYSLTSRPSRTTSTTTWKATFLSTRRSQLPWRT